VTRTDFVHLHVHTEGSFLDGIAPAKQYAERAAQMGQPALAETDHGNIVLAAEFYKECKKVDVEPIIGVEGYYVPSFSEVKSEKDGDRSHITVLARGARGYEVLAELVKASHEQFYYKPLMDRALLESLGDDAEHLTVLSGCANSELSRKLWRGDRHPERYDPEAAVEELLWWRETFPHYYIEIMDHGTAFDLELNNNLLGLARKYGLKHVVTNDPHYCYKEEHDTHDVMLAIQMAKDINDPDRMRFDGKGYWLKSRQEMYSTFKRRGYEPWVFKQGAANALRIARDSYLRVPAWEKKTWQVPNYPGVPKGLTSFEYLKKLTYRGLRRLGKYGEPDYMAQAKFELGVIHQVGIENFLLVTRGTIRFAGSVNIRVGPGRGSVAGSVVAWAIGLHKVDPLKYGLRFDRFLNPERPKAPDIDTDFQASRRSQIFEHEIDKYGADNTMYVAQFGTVKVKGAFNAISKAYGISFLDAQRLGADIHEEEDPDTGESYYVLPDEIEREFPEMAGHLKRLAGTKTRIGAHPAGLIIAPPEAELRKQVPEYWVPSSKRWVASFDKKVLEGMGLLKQDFLGLRCLDTIDECLKLIKLRQGLEFEPDDWVPDEEDGDAEVYAMLAKGDTSGVFQMEGPVNQRGCRDVLPQSFEDLVSITSLYRTGPIKAGYPAQFIANRKAGKSKIKYLHRMLKPILEATWGVILYQEQVMEIGEKLAGFDGVGVDEIKEAIKDKSSESMDSMRPRFIKGCKDTNGISTATATAIWDIIEGYAGYGYNRSHAVAYTLLTYQTARLKKIYPIEYYSALLRTVENSKENAPKRETYLRNAVADGGAEIWPPDINLSDQNATPDMAVDAIRFGLTDIKGIGAKQADKLLANRPEGGYQSFAEVAEAANNKGVMMALTNASALQCLDIPGDEKETERLLNWTFSDNMAPWREQYEAIVTHPSSDGGDVDLVGEIYQCIKGQTKTGKPYMTWKIRWDVTQAYDIRMWAECQRLWDLKPGSIVRVRGEWQQRWLNVTVGHHTDITILEPVR
jgi:DNA polymerase-3 subunit alpha